MENIAQQIQEMERVKFGAFQHGAVQFLGYLKELFSNTFQESHKRYNFRGVVCLNMETQYIQLGHLTVGTPVCTCVMELCDFYIKVLQALKNDSPTEFLSSNKVTWEEGWCITSAGIEINGALLETSNIGIHESGVLWNLNAKDLPFMLKDEFGRAMYTALKRSNSNEPTTVMSLRC